MLKVKKTKDVELIAKIDQEIFGAKEVEGKPADLSNDSYIWWLAYDAESGELAGFCGLKVFNEGGLCGYLCRSGIYRKFRGQGLQRKLIAIRDAEARRRNLHVNLTYTDRDNYPSANNLIRCGYTLYNPDYKYGLPNALYFRKKFK